MASPTPSISGSRSELAGGATFDAELMDGRTAVLHAVRVGVEGFALVARDAASGAVRATFELAALRVEGTREGEPFFVREGAAGGASLSCRDPALLVALRTLGVRGGTLLRSRRPLRWTPVLLAGVGLLAWAWYAGAPRIATLVAHRVPLEAERQLGREVAKFIAGDRVDDAGADAVLLRLAQRLNPSPLLAHDVGLVLTSEPNAFALPGGRIVLTCGLVRSVAAAAEGGGEEIAAVLAHELEHVSRRHLMQRVVRNALLSGMWSLAVGDYAGLMLIDPTTAFDIYNLQFSREEEAEADRGALARLRAAGLPTSGLRRFFERVAEAEEGGELPGWLSTHPATDERIAAAATLEDEAAETGVALDAAELEVLRAACDGPLSEP